ncbi:MAG: hypothetical protein M1836_003755 [Candelina mexicana]|nr:MAG: hypothetical protein M1836_003755 [Candelina mexicana]
MAPVRVTEDYYAILDIPHTASLEVITRNYRRLARILHPDKDPGNPGATASFQSLVSAYETISDPDKRRAYDTQWVHIRNSQRTQQEAKKRQAEAAETELRKVAKEKANRQEEGKQRQNRLRHLELLKTTYDGEIFEVNRVVVRLVADLKRIQDQDDEELRKKSEANSWWAFFTSPIYGKPEETEQQRQEQETERLQRLARKSIKENDLSQRRAKLQNLQGALQDVTSKITAEKREEEKEARIQAAERQERLRKEQETKRRVEEEQRRERQARWEEFQAKQWQEQVARAAKEAREAQEARNAQEKARAAQVAEAARKAKYARNDRFQPPTSSHSHHRTPTAKESTCRHDRYWRKLDGRHLCNTCHIVQKRFAFQCPGCSKIACASCRQALKSKGRRDSYDHDFQYSYYDYD